MWLQIAWKGRIQTVKSFECHTKEFEFNLGIMEDYQRLINGQVIIMRFMVYFVISFTDKIKNYRIAKNFKTQISKI